jgi:hypothetical protein
MSSCGEKREPENDRSGRDTTMGFTPHELAVIHERNLGNTMECHHRRRGARPTLFPTPMASLRSPGEAITY